MAISKSLKGVSVSITINGTKCTEYEAEDDETQHRYPNKTVLRYIEAVSGTNYSILNEVSSAYKLKSSLAFVVQVDPWEKDGNTNLELSEKAIKGQALSHGTEFGEAIQCQERTKIFGTKPQRGSSDPAAVFIFRYRSREALQAEHIIQRAESPDILHGYSEEEVRRIARESLAGTKCQTKDVKIKKEAGANGVVEVDPDLFSNEHAALTLDITGDKLVPIWKPGPPIERVDLRDR
ncbi:hypothetical protein VE02_06330 [Pseudogymnoascus sp. 03VT05]|nr:hypothetical protein VE02_06330 [Pseudogymnoascus sp. 03VT05]